jgi:hypothetical protein
VQQILIARKTMQYLKVCSWADIAAAPPGSAFLMHTNGHCVGIIKVDDGNIILADSSYPTRQKYTAQVFHTVVSTFLGNHVSARIVYFHLAPGNYTPEPVHPQFMCAAGCVRVKRPEKSNARSETLAPPAATLNNEEVLFSKLDRCIACEKYLSSRPAAAETQTAAVWTGAGWETILHGRKRCKCGLNYRLSFVLGRR